MLTSSHRNFLVGGPFHCDGQEAEVRPLQVSASYVGSEAGH